MNRRTLWLVVGLMSAALAGLVSIQFYWVRTAIALKQSQFDMAVQSALQTVVSRLETNEARSRVAQFVAEEPALDTTAPGLIAEAPAPVLKPIGRNKAVSQAADAPLPEYPCQPTTCVVIKDGKIVAYDSVLPPMATPPPPPMYPVRRTRWRSIEPGTSTTSVNAAPRRVVVQAAPVAGQDELQRQLERQLTHLARLSALEQRMAASSLNPRELEDLKRARTKLVQRMNAQGGSMWVATLDSTRLQVRTMSTVVEGGSLGAVRNDFMVTVGEGYRMEAWPTVPGTPQARHMADLARDAQQRERSHMQSQQASQREITRLNLKLQALRAAITDFVYNPPPAPERVDSSRIKELLAEELAARGISAHMSCSVNYGNPLVRLTSSGSVVPARPLQRTPGQTLYAAQLFPNDVRPQPYFLSVTFPDQRAYILNSISGILAICTILISCLVIGFTYTVRTILYQKKLGQMKTDFINNMTHEFKTPIATISLAAEAVGEPHVQQNPDKMSRFLRIIREENKRMEGQVERVLHMAEIERGQIQLSMASVDAHDILGDALNKIALQVEKRGGQISLNLQATRDTIHADALHLCNIFYNLLDNANKYSPDAPQISVATHNLGSMLRVTVSDKGIGMTESQQKRIFESFYRVHTGNRHDVKGFGLGLAYVRNMVQAHGGTIAVRSEPGKGSKFELCFPLRSHN